MTISEYLNFDLSIERLDQAYVARVLDGPTGPARNRFSLPFSDLEIENLFLRVGRSRRITRRMDSPEVEAIKSFGGRLYESVFSGQVGSALRSSLDLAAQRNTGLRLRLHLIDAPDLVGLPWEFLYNSALNRFFVLSRDTPLVRYLDLQELIQPLAIQPPLRVLAVIASPAGYTQLDVEQEWAKLQESLKDLRERGLVVLDRLEQSTLSALQRRLRQADYHVFHFVGHGAFDAGTQDGVLLMQDSSGLGRPVSGQDLGTLLHDQRTLRLAVLNACEGGRTSRNDPFAGTAQSLVQQGIPAVIAMQFEISDEAAITISHEFYGALADGYPVDAALAEARKAVFAGANQLEWGTPVLYLRAPDGRIFDVAPGRGSVGTSAAREASPPLPASGSAPSAAAPARGKKASAPATGRASRGAGEVAGEGAAAAPSKQGDRPAPRRTLPVPADVPASAAASTAPAQAATIPAAVKPARARTALWMGLAGSVLVLVIAAILVSGAGRFLLGGRQMATDTVALAAARLPERVAVAGQSTPTPGRAPTIASTSAPALVAQNTVAASTPIATALPPVATLESPTDTPEPPTSTPEPPTSTPAPPTATMVAPAASAARPTHAPALIAQPAAPGSDATGGRTEATNAAAGVVMNFAAAGQWVRGNQPYGTLTLTGKPGAEGRTFGKLAYDIPGAASEHFVVFRRLPALLLPGRPSVLTLWVFGDGSGDFLNVWIKDQQGQVRSFNFGRILHKNTWQAMSAPIDTSAPWPQGHIDGPDSLTLSYPISVYALVLDAYPRSDAASYTGTVYLDQMVVGGAAPGTGPSAAPLQ